MTDLVEATVRYDELAALVERVAAEGPSDPSVAQAAAGFVHREARLLDLHRFEDWLDLFTADAVAWVPLPGADHPGRDQSLYLDDRRRLGERVAWRRDPSSWGQQPASRTVRTVGGVEAWRVPAAGSIVVSSTLTLTEFRNGTTTHLAGRLVHELLDGATRCRSKITLVPQLAAGVRNPSYLL